MPFFSGWVLWVLSAPHTLHLHLQVRLLRFSSFPANPVTVSVSAVNPTKLKSN